MKLSEIKNTKPRREHGDLRSLAESIKREGLLQPLVINQNNELICGRRRFEALILLGWKDVPEHLFYPIKTISRPDKLKKSIDENIQRKDLLLSEKAAIAKQLWPQVEKEAEKRMKIAGKLFKTKDVTYGKFPQGATRDIVASQLNLSGRTLEKVMAIAEVGDKKLIKEMDKGKVNAIHKKLKRKEAEEEARKELSKLPNIGDRYEFIPKDITKIKNEVENDSIDWIITDPPYPKEYLSLYNSLSQFAATKLKPGGSLICMSGQSYLPEVIKRLGEHLSYHWCCAYLTPGPATQIFHRKAKSNWKPLLWFVKSSYEGESKQDVFKSDKPSKEHDEWGQSESGMTNIIKHFTMLNDLICDPFSGAGTTGLVALQLGRRFIGIDIDKNKIAIAKKRFEGIINASKT